MTIHRYLYTLCWRNKLLIPPLLIIISLVTFLIFSFGKHGEDLKLLSQRGGRHPHLVQHLQSDGGGNPQAHVVLADKGASKLHRLKVVDHHGHKHKQGPPQKRKGQHKFAVEHDGDSMNQAVKSPQKVQGEAPERDRLLERNPRGRGNKLIDNSVAHMLKGHDDHFDIEGDKLVPHNHEHPLPADGGDGMDAIREKHKVHRTFKPRKDTPTFTPKHRSSLYHDPQNLPTEFKMWQRESTSMCDEKFVAYHNEYAILHDVIIDMSSGHGRKGGEEIAAVLYQAEEAEYYEFDPGFFKLSCSSRPSYFFNNNNHLNKWINSLTTYDYNSGKVRPQLIEPFTIAITRYEYANLYHTMTDFYNAFLMMEFFNKTQRETNILIIDGHPKGALDPTWPVLFNSSTLISALPQNSKFSTLVWGTLGYNSPLMDHMAPTLPLTLEFRDFFLQSYKIKDKHVLNCDKISILFIWRRDYLAHPRNPAGKLTRKIANEQELVETLRKKFPSYNIKGIQIDLFDMQQQLQLIANCDVLVGMHGAGLTHALFLPKHAGLFEILPTYWSEANEHFRALATWRKLLYERWVNRDPANESEDHYTHVPPDIVNALTERIVYQMCSGETLPPREDESEVGSFRPAKKFDSR